MHLLVGGWVGGLATLVVHVVSFRVLTCVCLGPSVKRSPPDFGVCAATPTKYKGRVRRRPPLWMSCHGPPSEVFCLLVLQGYVNPWPSWVAVSRRFYNAECVIIILLVEEI